ncbi:HAD family hydrolase [Phyllobacterium sp. TAF24]|uniref:HAD family hydrolase n=1 Tax=Phyllobacterium sp. TAF24 TaxID=3233068 RepID=UPI003F999CD9
MNKKTAIAFFDVDETLIRTKSMFAFLKFFDMTFQSINADAIIDELRQRSHMGVNRAIINRAYWQAYRGLNRQTVRVAAHEWVKHQIQTGEDFFIQQTIDRLRQHQNQEHIIVLVSGSGVDLLEPISSILGADYTLATQLCEENGYYTGDISSPVMIGDGKAVAASALAGQLCIRTGDCFAYGDHISDLPLLNLVGFPTAVGEDDELIRHAKCHEWPIISSQKHTVK